MKSLIAGLALLMVAGLAGCAATHPADYSNMPGSGDNMAKGPGLFAVGQKDDYNGGYTVYSDNPRQKALINPNRRSDTQQAEQSPAPAPTAAERNDYQQYQQFQNYEDFQRFRNMPKDSPEYHKFQEWQQWQRYQQWKAKQQ